MHCAYISSYLKALGSASHFNYLANLVDAPAGVVPVTKVLKGEDQVYQDDINDNLTDIIRSDMKDTVGMPLGVQVLGLPYQDEQTLAVMKLIE